MKLLSKANSLAHKIKKSGLNWSKSLKAAFAGLKAKALMNDNIVTITYLKASGEKTTRLATLNSEFIPASKGTTKNWKRESAKISFWSVTDSGWRSFLPQNLISVDKVESVPELVGRLLQAA